MKRTQMGLLIATIIFLAGCEQEPEGKIPDTPSDPRTMVQDGSVYVLWGPAKDAERHILHRKEEGTSGDGEILTSSLSPQAYSWRDSTGIAGKTYTYAVRAANALGTSPLSAWTQPQVFPESAKEIPAAPVGLTVMASALDSIIIRWNWQSGGVTGYLVYRASSSNGPFSVVSGAIPLAGLMFTDSNVQPATEYWYSISAVNVIGESQRSTPIYAKTTSQGNSPGLSDDDWDRSDPNGTLTVINNTNFDMILFHTTASLTNILGGARSNMAVVKDISNKFPDFIIGGPMVILAMKRSEYEANLADLSKARIDYSAFASYGQGVHYRAILTSNYDGPYSWRAMNRLFNRGVEIRVGNRNGEKWAYLSPGQSPKTIYAASQDTITVYPVYVAYNTQSKSLVYYETNEWRETVDVAPRLTPSVVYQFPPPDIDINSMFNNITLPFATVIVQNNSTRVANFRVAYSQQTAQSNNPQLEAGARETFDIEGGAGDGTPLALNLSLVANQVSVPIRFEGSSELPQIKNGYIYTVVLNYIGTDIMNPNHYKAVIEEFAAIDTDQFLIAY